MAEGGNHVEYVVQHKICRCKVRTADPSDGPEIALELSGLAAEEPLTIGAMMQQTVSRVPNHVALCYQVEQTWMSITYQQYYDMCIAAAKSFLKLGLKSLRAVIIIGFNSTEWHVSALGTIFAGGLPCGLHTTSTPESCQLIAVDSRAQIAVVEDKHQLDKFLLVCEQLPELKAIIQYKGELSHNINFPKVYDWQQFLELGSSLEDNEIQIVMDKQKPNQCATLVYTSGTTGTPKGAMLSHDNVTWGAKSLLNTYQSIGFATEHIISYLPLSHIAAQMADIYLAITTAFTVHFAQPDALKGALGATLREVRPTIFFGVPRVYERIVEQIQEASASVTGLKKKISQWAMKKGLKGNHNRQINQPLPWGWSAANFFVFKKVRRALGFDRCKIIAAGGDSMCAETYQYLLSLNIPIMSFYGMSESCGLHCLSQMTPGHWKHDSAGKSIMGVRTRVNHPDENEAGEICLYGRHVFMGYIGNKPKTEDTIDSGGWLHTGDIGKFDEDGFLYVHGRIQETVILSGGEVVSPFSIESSILGEIPFLRRVMVVGDKRPHLICLMTLKCVIDADTGQPTDELSPLARRMIGSLGSHCTSVSQVVHSKDHAVFTAIAQRMERVNQRFDSSEHKVQNWAVLDLNFSTQGGELSPTLKIRRFFVQQKYNETINSLYTN